MTSYFWWWAISWCLILGSNASVRNVPCDKSRQIFTEPWGIITDGPSGYNYTQDTHCEWLIRASSPKKFVTLTFLSMGTECSYDYVFVYGGDTFKAPLLGSFSGKTDPEQVTSSSGTMLILFFSDTNYALGGFRAEYSITDCPRNCSDHGRCIKNSCDAPNCMPEYVCECADGWGNDDCSLEFCPDNCGLAQRRGNCLGNHCHCHRDYSGAGCTLFANDSVGNRWHIMSQMGHGFTPRAAHTSIYVEETDSLYVFGGYDLNKVLGDLAVFRFSSSLWVNQYDKVLERAQGASHPIDPVLWESVKHDILEDRLGVNLKSFLGALLFPFADNSTNVVHKNMHLTIPMTDHIYNSSLPGPSGRYGHAAARYGTGFAIYGGTLANGSLSDELWLYDVRSRKWSFRCPNCRFRPPPLARHTLTLVNGGGRNISYLYVYGGSLPDGQFSSALYRISLVPDRPDLDRWEKVQVRAGKEMDLRIVAHTTCYHAQTDSLLVYGGIRANLGRFSKLSDRMHLFSVKHQIWTELNYPRADLPDTYVPRERAFHTSNIVGNYMIVFGGYSHKHNKEEICYDNQMYLYHLGCHTWVSHEIFGLQPENISRYLKSQGIFAHSSAIRKARTLLILGGYHGNPTADFFAYVLPPILWDTRHPESLCSTHLSYTECASNPECGWCSVDAACYGRTQGLNCTTNLQTRRCPGVCPALGGCLGCLALGEGSKILGNSAADRLKLGKCRWCVQNGRCHHEDDTYGVCGVIEDAPFQQPGWWGTQGTEISNLNECKIKDKSPGLTFIKYKHPANYSQPDLVSIINATAVDIDMTSRENYPYYVNITARLLGYLRTPESWSNAKETLQMCTSYSNSILRLKKDSNPMNIVANMSTDAQRCIVAYWENSGPVELDSGRYLVDLTSQRLLNYAQTSSIMKLVFSNRNSELSRVFTFEYLEPFSNNSCDQYFNCLHCLTDSSCGWCSVTSKCLSRELSEEEHCVANLIPVHLITYPPACVNCSNYITCSDCLSDQGCEWWPESGRCERRGRSTQALLEKEMCSTECFTRKNCEDCLDGGGACVWCEGRQECFSFSVYTSQYQFGLCREWVDQLYASQITKTKGSSLCKNCSKYVNCSTCLSQLSCGWCYSVAYPIRGVCVGGDFDKPFNASCSNVINYTFPNDTVWEEGGWAYGQCPDVDECELKLDNCHAEAVCKNTEGSFTCECKRGFKGDGRRLCEKTCYETCIHGKCSGPSDYKCECDLGWTGIDCSIDCQCHNHSTCTSGPGICDNCQDWTTGQYCQFCRRGSYGNATAPEGCKPCDCNGHGHEPSGLCDITTGKCICQHNTEGDYCERCKRGYYGDPRNGGVCYFECTARGMVIGAESQGIGSPMIRLEEGEPVKECLWILSPTNLNGSKDTNSIIQLRIEASVNMPCEENSIFIYDKKPDMVLTMGSHHNHALGTFCNRGNNDPFLVESKTGVMTVVFKQGDNKEGFNATYKILSCPETCSGNRICRNNKCVCPDGFAGPLCNLTICPKNCSYALKQGVCDKNYGRCICQPEFGGTDCSIHLNNTNLIIFTELFNSERLSDGFDHLRKMIPRFGHTLVTDRRGSVWMFGGFSLSHGPLNDIRLFDTRNNTWMQVTIDSTKDGVMPQGRYLHAAEISHSRREIFVLGGISDHAGSFGISNNTLRDFWKFSILHQGWVEIQTELSPPPLAGHTMTLRKDLESESLLVIGGYSERFNFMEEIWDFDVSKETWTVIKAKGNGPKGLYGHSTVYHEPSKSFYVFGGYKLSSNSTDYSNTLYAFYYPSQTWSVLPSFKDYSSPPRARFLHTAITTDNFMLIYGGRLASPLEATEFMLAYVYACNQWVRLFFNNRDQHVVGSLPPWTFGHGMALDPETGAIYISGGFFGSLFSHVTRINLPMDLCNLWIGKEKCRLFVGCSYCAVSRAAAELSSDCYTSSRPLPDQCKYHNGTVITNNGVVCDAQWMNNRRCEQFGRCEDCVARWPIYWEGMRPGCAWREELGGCVRADASECENSPCTCSTSLSTPSPTIMPDVPSLCADYADCESCLYAMGGECVWATALQECIAKVHRPLYCAGGVCGLVLRDGEAGRCPVPCGQMTQCATCLHPTHCGWCAPPTLPPGQGTCLPGTLSGPLTPTACSPEHFHFLQCPLENECANGHHTCDPESEVCIDLEEGFHCVCADGYWDGGMGCEAVCPQGCVRGECVRPGVCQCDFGYVGGNCSIQCQCNGHSECEGPDKLDVCLECHNNTQGPQCEQCKPFFVGDPTNNGTCVPCIEYCHGHANICGSKALLLDSDVANKSRQELEAILEAGEVSGAVCLGCNESTTGDRCQDCLKGYFRGSEDLKVTCRPCECHGHGDTCDPVTGEKCNCTNNTESECMSGLSHKLSNQQCWMLQCSKCKESYHGTPTEGHQCFKQLTLESRLCLDPKLHAADECCKLNEDNLQKGHSVFIVVQPRYVNVDIRVVLDVIQGRFDLKMTPKDDALVVDPVRFKNYEVNWDTKYRQRGGPLGSLLDLGFPTNRTGKDDFFWTVEHEASGLTTYLTVRQRNIFVQVQNIENRLVITLPKDRFDLVNTKFYLSLTATAEENNSGIIFFRQDQLHIDLFVFFSVFFSCFFLFLAACVVAWKAKQAADMRRDRRLHEVERLHMAQRPFAGLILHLDYMASEDFKAKKCIELRPVAVEPTENNLAGIVTVFIQLPGSTSQSRTRLALASTLVLFSRSYNPLNSRVFSR